MLFARVFEENEHSRYGFDVVDNGWAMDADTFINIEGVAFSEMIFIRRDTNEYYSVALDEQVTWPRWGSHYNAGNGYTIAANPDHSGQVIRAYDADSGKHFQLCFRDSHNDECGPSSASDWHNYGDAGGNDGQKHALGWSRDPCSGDRYYVGLWSTAIERCVRDASTRRPDEGAPARAGGSHRSGSCARERDTMTHACIRLSCCDRSTRFF